MVSWLKMVPGTSYLPFLGQVILITSVVNEQLTRKILIRDMEQKEYSASASVIQCKCIGVTDKDDNEEYIATGYIQFSVSDFE